MMDSRQAFRNNLNFYMARSSLTQKDIVKALGVSKGSVSGWFAGTYFPRAEKLEELAQLFGISSADLLADRSVNTSVPVLGHVHAGETTYPIEEILDYIDIGSAKASQGDYFGLYVEGDSMLPELHDRDLVIVRKQTTLEDGDIGVFEIGDEGTTIKEYQRLKRHIVLMPFNDEYEGRFISFKEVDELPVLILGKVIEVRRSYV